MLPAPPAAPAPTAAPERSHHHTNAEGGRDTGRVVVSWKIVNRWIRIDRWTVNNDGIVRRHINNLRVGLLTHDYALAFDDLGFYYLLLGGFQTALILGLLAHALHRIHDIALLCQERVAQIASPPNVVCQPLYHIGQRGYCLDAGIHDCFATASASALSLRFLFFSSHRWSWMISRGYVAAARV
jgi:hypothetical protein